MKLIPPGSKMQLLLTLSLRATRSAVDDEVIVPPGSRTIWLNDTSESIWTLTMAP